MLSAIDTGRRGCVVFPVHTTISATPIFWILAGRRVCDPPGSLPFRAGPQLLLRLSRRPLHPGERWPGVRGNEDLRIADDAQVGAVSGGSRGAQGCRAGARCPAHDHPVWSQSVPVRYLTPTSVFAGQRAVGCQLLWILCPFAVLPEDTRGNQCCAARVSARSAGTVIRVISPARVRPVLPSG